MEMIIKVTLQIQTLHTYNDINRMQDGYLLTLRMQSICYYSFRANNYVRIF